VPVNFIMICKSEGSKEEKQSILCEVHSSATRLSVSQNNSAFTDGNSGINLMLGFHKSTDLKLMSKSITLTHVI